MAGRDSEVLHGENAASPSLSRDPTMSETPPVPATDEGKKRLRDNVDRLLAGAPSRSEGCRDPLLALVKLSPS